MFYTRVKGEVERDLAALGLQRLVVMRPSLLLGDPGVQRTDGTMITRRCHSLLGLAAPFTCEGDHGI
jgi:hypothetical protein